MKKIVTGPGFTQLIPYNQLPKTKAAVVENMDQIKDDVEGMVKLLDYGIYVDGKRRGAIALAHGQINAKHFNFFVVDGPYKKMFNGRRVIINPTIIDQSDYVPFEEGCLSFDKPAAQTRRFRNLKVSWQYPDGSGGLHWARTDDFSDLAAMVIQHEIDHANGENVHEKFAEYNR